jgi:phage FluMu gp28-like protein
MGRCQFMESHLPKWLQQDIKPQEGLISYPNGSFIQAVAGGADQIRGKVGSVIVEDEFAKQEEAAGVYQTIAPLLQKGSRCIVIGTPNGTNNTFATIYHGRPVGVERP